jgi:hypothetical protein
VTTAKRVTSLSAALLLAAQLFAPFLPAAYADDAKEAAEPFIATAETAIQSNSSADEEEDISIENEDGATADFFACINGDWVKVGSTTDLQGPEHLAGRERYYLSAEQLEEVYAPFGFDAESFSGEEYINQDVLAAYKKDSAAYKVLALTTCASDYSNARTVIITLIQE